MQLPAVCDTCGTIFGSGVGIIDARSVRVTAGGKAGPCPKCGDDGSVVDGKFDSSSGAMRIIDAPKRTHDVFAILEEAYRAAKEDRPIDEIARQLSNISESAASAAVTLHSRGGVTALVLFIFLLLQTCAKSTDGRIDWNLLVDQAISAITGSEPHAGVIELQSEAGRAKPRSKPGSTAAAPTEPKQKAQADKPKAQKNFRKKVLEKKASRSAFAPKAQKREKPPGFGTK